MADRRVWGLFMWVIFSCGVFLCASSPTNRKYVSVIETTSSDPAEVVTKDGELWSDTDEFDLEGDEDWLNEAFVISPSVSSLRSDYGDYDDDDDDDDYSHRKSSNVVVDLGEESDDDVSQDAEEEESNGNEAEFLFLPSRDNRLLLQDDDDQGGTIKVRHTGKNSYTDGFDTANSKEDKRDSNRQFEFTIDEDGDERDNEVEDDNDDFVLDASQPKDNNNVEVVSQRGTPDDDDDEDDDFVVAEDGNNFPMLDSPKEDSQVIYGDHVFLY